LTVVTVGVSVIRDCHACFTEAYLGFPTKQNETRFKIKWFLE
jgi:hypothetical protein